MKLVLGTVQFGLEYGVLNHAGQPSAGTVFKTLDTAWESGIRVLDSAQAYGQANNIIADYHHSCSKRFSVINKIMRHPESPEDIVASLSRELEMMNIDRFHCVMFHHAASIPPGLSNSFLEDLKKRGITDRVGLSIDTPADYKDLENKFHFDVIQLPLNVLSQNFMPDEFLDELKQNSIEIHARSVFLQGLILGKISDIPAYLQPIAANINAFQQACAALEISPAAGCMLYLLQKPQIDCIVAGVQDPAQLEEINNAFKAAKKALQEGEFLPWLDYACDDFDLISPMAWLRFKESSKNRA